jgi:DNA-binding MarR family transcriptional regulator
MNESSAALLDRPPRTGATCDDPIVVLLATARGVQERYEGALEAVGLSAPRYQALEALVRAAAPVTLGELAGHLCCVRSNITQLVDRLESDGLVQRASDPGDRRAVRAVVTEQGARQYAAGAEAVGRLKADLVGRLSREEWTQLQHALLALR